MGNATVIDADAYAYQIRMISAGGLGMDLPTLEAVSAYFILGYGP